MKKTVVLLLIAALCVPALFSCGEQGGNIQSSIPVVDTQQISPMQAVANMYSVSQPTKVSATTKHVIVEDILELNCTYEIITGYVDNLSASVYKASIEEIRSIEEGGQNEEVKGIIKSYDRVVESVEGKGSRTNGGDWKADGEVWTIGRGRMAINLDEALVNNVKYENHVLSFEVPEANVAQVLGEETAADVDGSVFVTITDDGAVVTSVNIAYFVKANEEANLEQTTMYISVNYTYDIEKITIE